MKTPIRIVLLTATFILHPSSFLLAQGPLTPPGAPAATMKTLDQIEPRTPISALPFTITSPGSYFITGNLTGVAGQNGITIGADNVTLDLGGFELAGGGTGLAGIRVNNVNATIRNGTLRGWSGSGVFGNTTETHVSHLRVHACTGNGIRVGNNGTVRNCEVRAIAGTGIATGVAAKVTECTATGQTGVIGSGFNLGAGSTVRDCVASANAFTGFSTAGSTTLTGCSATGNSSSGFSLTDYCSVSECSATSNGLDGFSFSTNCVFQNCAAAKQTTGGGFVGGFGSTLTNCTAANNQDGFNLAENASLQNCTALSNTGLGIVTTQAAHLTGCSALTNGSPTPAIGSAAISAGDGSVLSHCTATGNNAARAISVGSGSSLSFCVARNNTTIANASTGIFVLSQSTLTGCTASGNQNTSGIVNGATGAGISAGDGSTIQHCAADGNFGDGFRISLNSLIAGCTASGNGAGGGDGAGIHSTTATPTRNRIEGNSVTGNDRGIDVDGSANVIIRNTASNNAINNYDIVGSNRYGPIVDMTAAGAPAAAGNAAASTLTNVEPNANFAH